MSANDIATDEGLQTAVIISLFTERRAEDGDVLPLGQTDRRGWWGDTLPDVAEDRLGSRLWLLDREKEQVSVLVRAEEYAREAVQWLLDDRVASRVDVTTEITRPGMLGILIVIHRPLVDPVEYRFDRAWAAQEARST